MGCIVPEKTKKSYDILCWFELIFIVGYLEGLDGLVVNKMHVEKYYSLVDLTDRWLYSLVSSLEHND